MVEAGIGNQPTDRRKRVQRLKKIIIFTLLAAMTVPTILCIVLFVKLKDTRQELEYWKQEASAAKAAEEEAALTSVYTTAHLEESPRGEQEDAAKRLQVPDLLTSDISEADIPDNYRRIYLTFDDGPSSNTGAILDILKEYGVKATFFVIGKTDGQSRQYYRRIVEEGHTLGMHSYSHRYQEIYGSLEDFSNDLTRLQEYLYEETGIWTRYCRFPGGSSNTVSKVDMQELITYLNEQNITYFDWNISSGDAASEYISRESIINNCMAQIDSKHLGVILMHDTAEKSTTVEALPELIEKILDMEDTVILPISDDTVPIQHINSQSDR